MHASDPEVAQALGYWSRWTGRRIGRGEQFGVRQHEESLTSSLLLDLQQNLPDLRVRTLTHSEETDEGADWEWWIEGDLKWFGALIQAKRLTAKETYSFAYKPAVSKKNPHPRRQVDALIAKARALGIPPLYVLYNDTTDASAALSSPACQQQLFLPRGSSGVTVLDAFTARWLADRYPTKAVPASEVAPYAVPWSCLTSCPVTCPFHRSLPKAMGLRGRAAAVAAVAYGLAAPAWSNERRDDLASTQNTGIQDEPPTYIPPRDQTATDEVWAVGTTAEQVDEPARYIVALYSQRRNAINDNE